MAGVAVGLPSTAVRRPWRRPVQDEDDTVRLDDWECCISPLPPLLRQLCEYEKAITPRILLAPTTADRMPPERNRVHVCICHSTSSNHSCRIPVFDNIESVAEPDIYSEYNLSDTKWENRFNLARAAIEYQPNYNQCSQASSPSIFSLERDKRYILCPCRGRTPDCSPS